MIKEEKPQEFLPALLPKRSRTFAGLIDGITLSVAAILVIVIFMMYLTEVSFNGSIDWKNVGFSGALMYVCTVSFYFLLRSFSSRKGRLTENHTKARERIERNNDIIVQKGYAARTREYCRAWEDAELDSARSHVLADAGISLADFKEKYCAYGAKELAAAFPNLTEYQRETVARAKKIKRLRYDESYLTVYDRHGRRKSPSGGFTTRTLRRVQTLQTLVTTALSSVFSVYMALDIIADPSFATVVLCLVKVVIVLGSGAWGMIGGWNMSSVREVEEMGAKGDEQERFIKWCEITPIQTPVSAAGFAPADIPAV